MLKLVTQFDNPEMKPSVATPTCGGCCCCCCCCVVTTFATGVITSRNVAHAISSQKTKKVEEIKPVKLKIIGTISFLASFVGGIFAAVTFKSLVIGTMILVVLHSLFMAYLVKQAKLKVCIAIATVILTAIAVYAEAWIWMMILG